MNKEEIFRYLKVSSSKSIIVSRKLLKEYPGIIREIIIRPNVKLQIKFLDKNIIDIDEGEISLYFYYENYDKLFESLEEYIGMKIDDWSNLTKTNEYPISEGENLQKSWDKLKRDFSNKILELPQKYKQFDIRDLYWTALYSGEVKVDDSWNKYEKWLKKKKDEEEKLYE